MTQYSENTLLQDPNTSWQKAIKLIKPNTAILDVGCSSGNFGKELIKTKNCIVDGVEINKSDAELAKKKLNHVYVLDVENDDLGVIKEQYDHLFCGDIIEHFARPADTLKRMKPLLKNTGKIIFAIPNIVHMSVRLMLLEGKIEYGKTGLLDETHLHFYNTKEVYRIFNEAGYNIDIFDYTQKGLPFEYVRKQLQKIGLMPQEKFRELMQTPDAVAYQFIGVATISSATKKQKLPDVSPVNDVQEFLDHYVAKVRELEEHIRNVEADRHRIKVENEVLRRNIRNKIIIKLQNLRKK